MAALEKTLEHRVRLSQYLVHDLRGVLGGISSTLDYLAMVAPGTALAENPDIADSLADMTDAARLMTRMVGDLYEVEQFAAGEIGARAIEIDIAALVRKVADARVATERTKAIELVCSIGDPASSTIVTDAYWVERVLWNLLDNACRNAPARSAVRVEVAGGEGQAGAGGDVVVSVVDEGGAMPPDHCPRAFDSDYRVWGKEAGGRPGRGVALEFVKYAVEQLGGTVGVDPLPPRATRFWFSLSRSRDRRTNAT